MARLNRITIKGFKSIRDMTLEMRPLNVLIGVNGAGKSNLVAFFKMINEMMGGRLQQYIATTGRAQSLLHFGPKVTPEMSARLEFAAVSGMKGDRGTDTYVMRLIPAANDTLVFAYEGFERADNVVINATGIGVGHQETHVNEVADEGDSTARDFRRVLNACRVFHFHDTSATARIRQFCYVGDDRRLMSDAGNLSAVLYRLRNKDDALAYRRILTLIRRIAPFFSDFELEPTGVGDKDIILNWRQKGSDQLFGPHQLSDGTLRAMALITLLQQPMEDLPDLIVVDEPELGLHPTAKTIIAALFQKVSHHCQVIVATQSAEFLDGFNAEDVIVVERDEKESKFLRQDGARLQEWLEEYSMGQLWEKNVLGGGPFS